MFFLFPSCISWAGVRGAVVITPVKTQNISSNPGERNSLKIKWLTPQSSNAARTNVLSLEWDSEDLQYSRVSLEERPSSEYVKDTHP